MNNRTIYLITLSFIFLISCQKKDKLQQSAKLNFDLFEIRIINMESTKHYKTPNELLNDPEYHKTLYTQIYYAYDNDCSGKADCSDRIFGTVEVQAGTKVPVIWYQINQRNDFYDVTVEFPVDATNAKIALLRNGEIIDTKSQTKINEPRVRFTKDKTGKLF